MDICTVDKTFCKSSGDCEGNDVCCFLSMKDRSFAVFSQNRCIDANICSELRSQIVSWPE